MTSTLLLSLTRRIWNLGGQSFHILLVKLSSKVDVITQSDPSSKVKLGILMWSNFKFLNQFSQLCVDFSVLRDRLHQLVGRQDHGDWLSQRKNNLSLLGEILQVASLRVAS